MSSETPLPPPFPGRWEVAQHDQLHDEILEFLDDEIEMIECPDESYRAGSAADHYQRDSSTAFTAPQVFEQLSRLAAMDGFIGAALACSDSGRCVDCLGGGAVINLEIAAAANAEVVRSERKALQALDLHDDIEETLITMGLQYHLIRPVRARPNLFLCVVLERQLANLAMARFILADTESSLLM